MKYGIFKKHVSGTEFQNSFLVASELSFPLFEKWVALGCFRLNVFVQLSP